MTTGDRGGLLVADCGLTRRWTISALSLAGAVLLLLAAGGFRDRVIAADAQPGVASIACVDPKATFVLGDPDVMRRHTARWSASVGRRGRCFTIEPGEHWERVMAIGGLVLMRKVPPEPGVPPLYFRADRLVGGIGAAGTERASSGTAGLAAPAQGANGLAPAAGAGVAGRPGRVATRGGRAVTEILTETLPPLPTAELPDPAAIAPKQPMIGTIPDVDPVPFGPISVPLPVRQAPADAARSPVSEVPLAAPSAMPAASGAPAIPTSIMPVPISRRPIPDQTDLSVASARGYVFGFAITITLIVLLLAALVIVLRMVLRRPPEPEPGSLHDDSRLREPMLRALPPFARPAGRVGTVRDRRSGDAARPVPGWPGSRKPVVAGPFVGTAIRGEPVRIQPAIIQGGMHQGDVREAGLVADAPTAMPVSELERCAARLREAGWEVDVRTGAGRRLADVVARRDGRVMTLRCLASANPVGEEDVEEACFVRERERADLAVIVSGAPFTAGARQLAGRTGVELLPDDGLQAYLAC